MTQREEGRFTISTRVFLSAAQRDRLQQLVIEEGVDLPELLSQLLTSYVDSLPAPSAVPEETSDISAELSQRRAELRRVRTRQRSAGDDAPKWLAGYISELEHEIMQLEQRAVQS